MVTYSTPRNAEKIDMQWTNGGCLTISPWRKALCRSRFGAMPGILTREAVLSKREGKTCPAKCHN